MNRHTIFGGPNLLGFERLARLLEPNTESVGANYPPYNIEEFADRSLRVSRAVAGFLKDELKHHAKEDHQRVSGATRRRQMPKRSFTAALQPDNFCAALCWLTASKSLLRRWKTDC